MVDHAIDVGCQIVDGEAKTFRGEETSGWKGNIRGVDEVESRQQVSGATVSSVWRCVE